MLATRNEKGQIVLTLESDAEAKDLWFRLNVPPHIFAKWYEKEYGETSDYDKTFNGFDMWNALDEVVNPNEEAKC